jgi:hypothetical protein
VGSDNNWNFESIMKFTAKSTVNPYQFRITCISEDAEAEFG